MPLEMTTSNARELLISYKDDSWFETPHNIKRFVKSLKPFIKKIELQEGDLISHETEQRVFKEYMKEYVLIMKEYVIFFMRKT